MNRLNDLLRATSALIALPLLAAAPAWADCQPDPAASGQTVTCTGTDNNGFVAGGGVSTLTFNVLAGATVTNGFSSVVLLNGGNTVTNAGTITAIGFGAFGIRLTAAANTVTNTGMIAASGDAGVGIDLFAGANTVTNIGTIVASGSGTTGIALSASANTVTNFGAVAVSGVAAIGIFVTAGANTVTNSGTIAASGTAANGIALSASGNTVTNIGMIAASGNGADGIVLNASANTVTNSGTIAASGSFAEGIRVQAAANTVINTGTIAASGSVASGISLLAFANTVTNAAGGLIVADAGVGAVATAGGTGTGTLTNLGTIDGRLTANDPGLLTVNGGLIQVSTGAVGQAHAVGAFTQTAAGILALRANAAGASDRLGAAAAATLGGTLRAVVQPGLYNNVTVYPNAVTATGLGGTQFATVASTSAFLAASAAYAPTAVTLTLTRIGFGSVPGETQNQQALGAALESLYSTGATGAAATIFGTLLASPSVAALDGLSGEAGTGGQAPSFAMGDAFFGALLGQMQRWRDGQGAGGGGAGAQTASGAYRVQFAAAQPSFALAEAYAQATPAGAGAWPPRSAGRPWSAWASGFGLSGSRAGDAGIGSGNLHYSMGGGAAGFDVQLAPGLLGGLAVAGAGSDFSIDGRSANGTARTIFFGAYGSWTMGALYVDAALSYGRGQFSTTRLATLGTTTERATGSFDGNQLGGQVETGWRFALNRYALTPFAGVAVQSLRQDGYGETSVNTATGVPGILGLSYQAQTTTSVRSVLGAAAATTVQLGERATLTPRIRAAWAHEFNADRQVNASFLSIPGAAFTATGARPARDAAVVTAGVDVGLGRIVTLYAQFDGDLSGGGNAYAGSGGLRISW